MEQDQIIRTTKKSSSKGPNRDEDDKEDQTGRQERRKGPERTMERDQE